MGQRDAANEQAMESQARRAAATKIEAGRALLDQGDLNAAIRTFDEATGLDPMNGAAWNDLAVALYQKGEAELAIGCFYTALKADPTFADAAMNLATLLREAGRPTDGVPGLRSVLFHDPENEDVREMLMELGVTAPKPIAVLALEAGGDVDRVIEACLTEWNYLIVRPDEAQLAGYGGRNTAEAWTSWLAAVRPETVIVDPENVDAASLRAAAEALGAKVAVLGEDLPDGTPLVDLARELTDGIPEARETWDDVPRPAPVVSVLVQATNIAHAINILDRLSTQDLAMGLFEVIVVDRAYGEAATSLIEPEEYAYDLTIIRNEGAGLGTARNLAMAAARGTWLVFFDEESRPGPANLRGHLQAQVACARPTAVLGAYALHPNLIDNSFRKLLNTSNLLYAQPSIVTGTEHGGAAFRANNLSVPKAEIQAVGAFDNTFSAGCEDTDMGLRLERERGMRVRYDDSLKADVDYPFTVGDFQVEQLVRGWACVHLAQKNDAPAFLIDVDREVLDDTWFNQRRKMADEAASQANDLAQRVIAVCNAEEPYRKTGASEIIEDIVRVIGMQAFNRGIAIAHAGFKLEDERMPGTLTRAVLPVVVRPGGDMQATLMSLEATMGPIAVFVPEGTTYDGNMEIRTGELAEAMALGAPALAWIEAGYTLPPSWRTHMLETLEAWPDHGAVQPSLTAGPATNRPSPPPVIVVVREVVQGLGDDATEILDSPTVNSRIAKTGYRNVQTPRVQVGVAQSLEKAG